MKHLLGPHTRQKPWYQRPCFVDLMINLVPLSKAIAALIDKIQLYFRLPKPWNTLSLL